MRIGVYGGTFDPPHLGHLRLALAALDGLGLDEIIFMPANKNPNKSAPVAAGRHRVEMVRRMIADQPKLSVSDLEITRGGPSYAVDTLSELHMVRPAEYWFLLGADALKDLPNWKQPQRLLKLCRLGVVVRPPTTDVQAIAAIPQEHRDHVDIVKMEPCDISSTDIRIRVAQNQPIATIVHPAVAQYIKENKLYRG